MSARRRHPIGTALRSAANGALGPLSQIVVRLLKVSCIRLTSLWKLVVSLPLRHHVTHPTAYRQLRMKLTNRKRNSRLSLHL